MKDDINLLPPKVLARRRRLIIMDRVGEVWRRVIVAEILLIGLVGAGIGANRMLEQIVSRQIGARNDSQADLYADVKQINQWLQDVSAWQSKYQAWVPITKGILEALPEGVRVGKIETDATGQITVQGEFSRPEQIVAYQRALEQLPGVKRVDAPLSNYSTGSEYQFNLVVIQAYGSPQ